MTGSLGVLVAPEEAERFEGLVRVEIDPDVIYDSLQAATLLRFEGSPKNRRNGIYRIPESKLTRVRIAGGGRWGYPGWALIRYLDENTKGRTREEGT